MEATTARQLEAAGATSVTFEFRGTAITIPLAIEDWPLDAVRARKPATAVRALLGAQRPPMRTRGDVIELSHRMADACGVTPLPEQDAPAAAALGAVPQLIDLVDNHGDDLEADLARLFHVDYRMPPPAGPTLRQVWVYVRRMVRESALLAARNGGEPPWSREAILQARTWELWTQKRYSGRPPTREEYDEWVARQAAIDADRDHLAGREYYYSSGQNMRDAGQDPGPRAPQQPPAQSSPVSRALAVARKNALRTPRKGAADGRQPELRRRYDPAGSGWG